ncbi:MAG: hypothetical protein H6815_05910 [Phycisphaeraceae bacterium]|nr:hypothetical protein [Phycisphaerales bacterium]MCB9859974.1 hypothetical protein [Phycisphaeraceae bacterium]
MGKTDDSDLTAEPKGTLCLRCGYDIAGLDIDSVCPECAEPIKYSMRGDRLEYADPDYVRKLARGAMLIPNAVVFGLLVIVAILVIAVFLSSIAPAIANLVPGSLKLAFYICSVLGACGWWLLTTPDPIEQDTPQRMRHLARISVVTAVSIGVINEACNLVWRSPSPGRVMVLQTQTLLILIALVLVLFFGMRSVRALASRIPDTKIRNLTNRVLLSFVITTVSHLLWFGMNAAMPTPAPPAAGAGSAYVFKSLLFAGAALVVMLSSLGSGLYFLASLLFLHFRLSARLSEIVKRQKTAARQIEPPSPADV